MKPPRSSPSLLPVLLAVSALMLFSATGKSTSSKLPVVEIDGIYFVRGGKRFIPVGAHWVPAKTGMQWPLRWDPADIEADFVKMKDLGFTLVRFDMLWAWFEPKAGEYNEEAFRQLDQLIVLAHKHQIYLHPSLFIGGEVGEAYWDVPWRNGRNPHTDVEMVRLETAHAAELGRRYAGESAIIAWDLTDEPPFWITTGITDAQAMQWTHAIAADGIRKHDKLHPIVVGTSGQEASHGPFRSDVLAKGKDVDFFSVHPFTIYRPELFPDPMLSERSTYGASFDIALARGAGRPAMVHEMGASTAQYSPERIARYERANLYSALGAGTIGVNLWCYSDAATELHSKLPYVRTAQETEWGLVTWDRKDKPRGREFRQFASLISQLDLAGVEPAVGEAGIVIPEEWAKPQGDFSGFGLSPKDPIPYVSTEDVVGSSAKLDSGNTWLMGGLLSSFILARRAGMKSEFPREQTTDWSKYPLLFMPSPLTSTSTPFLTHVHTDFYARVTKYVDSGGFLYASVAADAAVPNMDALFGAHLADTKTDKEITIKIVQAFGPLAVGDVFHFTVPTASSRYWGSMLELSKGPRIAGAAHVIAIDQDGHPAIVTGTLGRGKTVLSAYPIESYLAVMPSAFDKANDAAASRQDMRVSHLADLLYRAMRDVSGVKPLFRSDDPTVEVTALSATERGYAIVVNHSDVARKVTITSSRPIKGLVRIAPSNQVTNTITPNGSQWQMDIGPFDGAIVEWR